MTGYQNFNVDFIKRTLDILENYKGSYEVTNLINCAVGLIIIPRENHFNCLDSVEMEDIESKYSINESSIRYIRDNSTLKNIVKHMRNSIAHGNIFQELVYDGNIKSLRFKDEYKGNRTFEAVLTVDELRNFSIAVAKEVLRKSEMI